ncbi:MAG: hypothetical protein ACK5AK_08935, partial [Gemmatimonas sp.]
MGKVRQWLQVAMTSLAVGGAALVGACRGTTSSAVSPGPTGSDGVVRLLLVNDVYVTDTLRDGTGG